MPTIPCDLALPRFCPRCGLNQPCLMRNKPAPVMFWVSALRYTIPNRLHGAAITNEGDAI